jgi:ornithine cyclodeaminase/alanine dehydrogenase-like protein (mu-crystallin family)
MNIVDNLIMNSPVGSQQSAFVDTTTLVLTRDFIAARVPASAYVAAVRRAFEQLAQGQLDAPPVAHVRGFDGAFHIKSATALEAPRRLAIKINGNFPDNRSRHGLPTIQGVIALFDAECGRLLALMDSVEVTAQRTAAASVVAAQSFADPQARRLAFIGCGTQARYHLAAFLAAFPILSVACYDIDAEAANRFAGDVAARGLDARVASSAHAAADQADIIVTCTASRVPVLGRDDVGPGCFIAAVGADDPRKHEIAPEMLQRARVVPDVLAQACVMGDLHHAIEAGTMKAEDIHAELADIVSGRIAGRTRAEQIFVFDSTGTAITDLAAANVIFDLAQADPAAPRFKLAG